MESVYKALKTVLLFLIIVFVIQTFFGDKMTQNMSLMILFSMLLLNSETVVKYMSAITNNLTSNI